MDNSTTDILGRRSRRTHKNSKDGCPNCRANRIKCSEELPSCSHCLRKGLRCGYLDFPPEKLEHIRNKNRNRPPDVLRRNSPQVTRSPVPPSQMPQVPSQPQIPQPSMAHTPVPSHAAHVPGQTTPMGHMTPMGHLTPMGQTPMGQTPMHQPLRQNTHTPLTGPPHVSPSPGPFSGNPLPPQNPQHAFPHPHMNQNLPRMVPPHLSGPVMGVHLSMPHNPPTGPPTGPPGHSGSPFPNQYQNYNMDYGHLQPTPRPDSTPDAASGLRDSSKMLQEPRSEKSSLMERNSPLLPSAEFQEQPHEELSGEPSNQLRSMMYSNAFWYFNHEFGELEGIEPPEADPWDIFSHNVSAMSLEFDVAFGKDPNTAAETHPAVAQSVTLSPGVSGAKPEAGEQYKHVNGSVESERTNSSSLPSNKTESPVSVKTASASRAVRVGSPLPNCIMKATAFPVLAVPDYLKSGPPKFRCEPSRVWTPEVLHPIWNENDSRLFWFEIFDKASNYHFFHSYIIDKSVGILLRACEAVVNGDILSGSHFWSSTRVAPFYYNKKDLDVLTRKSYVAYGRVIAELRESVEHLDSELAAKMSLFSAWACYLNASSDFQIFNLLLTGSGMLLRRYLSEDVPPGQYSKRELLMLKTFANQAAYPDYNLEVVMELRMSFIHFKHFIETFFDRNPIVDEDTRTVLLDPLFMHDLHEFDKFMRRLIDVYTPSVRNINSHYKREYNRSDFGNINFCSPTLIYDMAFDWFKVYPGDRVSMSPNAHPLKRVLYIFYHSLAKLMSHLCTPCKSISFVDMCNVISTKVDMPLSMPAKMNEPAFSVLKPIVMRLFKSVRFFESRSRLYAYFLNGTAVLDTKYLSSEVPCPPAEWKYRDIVEITAEKAKVAETQVTTFDGILTVENFPFSEQLKQDAIGGKIIADEIQRQTQALENEPFEFDYNSGFSNHDFNPVAAVDRWVTMTLDYEYRDRAVVKQRIDNFLASRNEITVACSRWTE